MQGKKLPRHLVPLSCACSKYLRHNPEEIGITLEGEGWANVDELIAGVRSKGLDLTLDKLKTIVNNCPKQRFSFSEDGTEIKANQGHSDEVVQKYHLTMDLTPDQPPDILYHGTTSLAVDAIMKEGISKMTRHHVHLTPNLDTARHSGARWKRGSPVVLKVDAKQMYADNVEFFVSRNNVWCTLHVDPRYISVM